MSRYSPIVGRGCWRLASCRGPGPTSRPGPRTRTKAKAAEKKGLPLKPDRTIEFTAEAGTWVTLDVSPDGKTILFDLLGDLYTVPIDGGEAKAIAAGLAFEGQAKFSPDGKRIAYVSDRDGAENLWIANADGSDPRQLTRDKQAQYTSPSWTPDGDYVLVSRQESPLRSPLRPLDVPRQGRGGRAGDQGQAQARRPERGGDPRRRRGRHRGRRPLLLHQARRRRSAPTTTWISRSPRSSAATGSPAIEDDGDRAPRQRASARPSRPTGPGSSTGPARTARPACGSASWPRARSAGSSSRSSATSRSRCSPATSCRATPSRPTASRSSRPTAARSTGSTSPRARTR